MRANQKSAILRPGYSILWFSLAVASLAMLAKIVTTQDRHDLLRWSVFLSTNPQQGSAIFRTKGCIHCHAVNGAGGKVGPDLGGAGGHPADLSFLVTAMWNHAPNMWKRIRDENFSYPDLNYEETSYLMAYLFIASHMDGPGDAHRGKSLFTSKGCIRCHASTNRGDERSTHWSDIGATMTPTAWNAALWESAPAMDEAMKKQGMTWPKLDQTDLKDMLAYARELGHQDASEAQHFPGDPERGWQIFQKKSCITCHELNQSDAGAPPKLPPNKWQAATFSEVGELMWNRAPEMARAMDSQGITYPDFSDEEMADLIAFVYSLQYFDPPGSSVVGKSVFDWRGCSLCHGDSAEGTRSAPALRGHGKNYNSISLATALWSHGPKMYDFAQTSGLDWPTLREDDIGDLLAFLNSPVPESHSQRQK